MDPGARLEVNKELKDRVLVGEAPIDFTDEGVCLLSAVFVNHTADRPDGTELEDNLNDTHKVVWVRCVKLVKRIETFLVFGNTYTFYKCAVKANGLFITRESQLHKNNAARLHKSTYLTSISVNSVE